MTTERTDNGIDWTLTSWEGSRREQLRRWAKLPLERIIAAQEEMAEISEHLAPMRERAPSRHASKDPVGAARDASSKRSNDPSGFLW